MNNKPLGNILASTSIDDTASAAVRAARMWGDEAAITITESGECTAWMAHTPTIDRYVAEHPGELVGVYVCGSITATVARRNMVQQIAEDMRWHVIKRHGMRALA